MKKISLVAYLALGLLAGCQKDKPEVELPPVDDTERVAVQFGLTAPGIEVVSKAIGPIDSWASQKLNIIGVKRFGAYDADESYLIDNIIVEAPSSPEDDFNVSHPMEEPYAGEPYFYAENTLYDFYGYHIDDAASSEIVKTANSISIPLILDGSQDVLVAKARPIYDIMHSEDVRAVDVNESDAYSAYAARRGVQPTLSFNHLLTRFQFYVVDGNKGTAEYPVEVTGIQMDGKSIATLQIAPEPMLIVTDETKTFLSLGGLVDESGDGMTPALDYVSPENPGSAKTKHSLMFISGEKSHKIKISMKFADDANTQPLEDITFDLNAYEIIKTNGNVGIDCFEAGYQYDIVLIVYGPEEVKVTALLTNWDKGGNTVIDPDEVVEKAVKVNTVETTSSSITYNLSARISVEEVLATIAKEGEEPDWSSAVSQTWTKASQKLSFTFDGLTSGKYVLYMKYRYVTKEDFEAEILEVAAPKAVIE